MMQTTTKERVAERVRQLHCIAPDSIGDLLRFELLSCDEGKGEYTFSCETAPWMRNTMGKLHGGMSAVILDQAMGIVVFGIIPENGVAPTIQMQQYYHKPFPPGEKGRVVVTITAASGKLIHMKAELFRESEPKFVCVSATAIYYYKSFSK